MKICVDCEKKVEVLFPGDLCKDCYKEEMPSRKDLEEKWKEFTGPPMDRMMKVEGKSSEVVTK